MVHFKKYVLFIISLSCCLTACSKLIIRDWDPGSNANWTQFGKNPQHTSQSDLELAFPLKMKWMKSMSSAINPVLVVVDDVLFCGTVDGKLRAISLESGKSLGKLKYRSKDVVTGAYYDGSLLIIRRTDPKNVIRHDLITGKKNWETPFGPILSEPTFVDGKVYIASLDGKLAILDFINGQEMAKIQLPAQVYTSPAVKREILVIGDNNGIIHGLDQSLKKMWQFATGSSIRATAALGQHVFVGSTDRNFYALDIQSGAEMWRFQTQGKIYHAASLSDNYVVFGSTDRKVYCLRQDTGEKIWEFEAGSVISTSPAIAGQAVFFGSLDKNMYAVNLETGEKKWSFEAKGRVRGHPIVAKDRLFFTSEDDLLYCFGME